MNRRNFLRSMLGVAAATALPSEVFPFRKIFLPENPKPIDPYTWAGLARSPYPGRLATPLTEAHIEAIELEMFAKEIPDLIFRDSSVYELFKRHIAEVVWTDGILVSHTPMRIPAEFHYLNEAYVESDMIVTNVDPIEKSVTMAPKPKRRSLRELLHGPAMPENVMEFIDGLESDLSKS